MIECENSTNGFSNWHNREVNFEVESGSLIVLEDTPGTFRITYCFQNSNTFPPEHHKAYHNRVTRSNCDGHRFCPSINYKINIICENRAACRLARNISPDCNIVLVSDFFGCNNIDIFIDRKAIGMGLTQTSMLFVASPQMNREENTLCPGYT